MFYQFNSARYFDFYSDNFNTIQGLQFIYFIQSIFLPSTEKHPARQFIYFQ